MQTRRTPGPPWWPPAGAARTRPLTFWRRRPGPPSFWGCPRGRGWTHRNPAPQDSPSCRLRHGSRCGWGGTSSSGPSTRRLAWGSSNPPSHRTLFDSPEGPTFGVLHTGERRLSQRRRLLCCESCEEYKSISVCRRYATVKLQIQGRFVAAPAPVRDESRTRAAPVNLRWHSSTGSSTSSSASGSTGTISLCFVKSLAQSS